MPLKLHDELPKGYETHNSAGEHSAKHMGDADRINSMRWGRHLPSMPLSEMYRDMHEGGVVLTNKLLGNREFGKPAGYIWAHRADRVVTVRDFWVRSTERNRGVGGALLGRMITNVPRDTRQRGRLAASYGNWLDIGGHTLALPGIHVTALTKDLPEDLIERFVNTIDTDPRQSNRNGIRSVDGGKHYGHVVFREGKEVGRIEPRDGGYGVAGRPESATQSHIVFAAIDLLNGPPPWLAEQRYEGE